MRVVLGALASWAVEADDGFLDRIWSDLLTRYGPDGALREALTRWAAADPRPLALLIDEIDALAGDSLLAVLRQLRAGYVRRPAGFPQSVVLCGVRDVRDYRLSARRLTALDAAQGSTTSCQDSASQLTTFRSGTRPNSASLFVTSVAPTARACAAISRSLAPMSRPLRVSASRISP